MSLSAEDILRRILEDGSTKTNEAGNNFGRVFGGFRVEYV